MGPAHCTRSPLGPPKAPGVAGTDALNRSIVIIGEEAEAYLAKHPERERMVRLLIVTLEILRRGGHTELLDYDVWSDDMIALYDRIMTRLVSETDWGRRAD